MNLNIQMDFYPTELSYINYYQSRSTTSYIARYLN